MKKNTVNQTSKPKNNTTKIPTSSLLNSPVIKVLHATICNHLLLTLAIVIAVLGAIIVALLPPMVLGIIVDTITDGQITSLRMIILYFLLLALAAFMESAREGLLTIFGQKITHALRSALMEKFTRLSTREMSLLEPGRLVPWFSGNVDKVESLFSSGVISMFADGCKIISILVVLWFQNQGLTIILIILLPLLFAFTRHVQKGMLAAQIANRKAVGRSSALVPETLHNIRTIHNLSKEEYMKTRYEKHIDESYTAMNRTNFYDAVYSPIILVINALVVAFIMILTASGKPSVLTFFGMSAGTAVAVINYISQIFTPVESLGMEIQTIQSAMAGVHRINDFFALEESPQFFKDDNDTIPRSHARNSQGSADLNIKDNFSGTNNGDSENLLEFRDVSFGYDSRKVLDHLNFEIKKGEQVTFIGRTGAGKSTIFKLILGLYHPEKGQILLNGAPIASIPESERRCLFGYVEQSFHMVPGTVRDQITLFDTNIAQESIEHAVWLTGLSYAIDHLANGYDTPCTPELFSQGQWQLLSIARAIVTDPKLLLLDEITANLDSSTEEKIMQALKNAADGRTVLSISHRTTSKFGRTISI